MAKRTSPRDGATATAAAKVLPSGSRVTKQRVAFAPRTSRRALWTTTNFPVAANMRLLGGPRAIATLRLVSRGRDEPAVPNTSRKVRKRSRLTVSSSCVSNAVRGGVSGSLRLLRSFAMTAYLRVGPANHLLFRRLGLRTLTNAAPTTVCQTADKIYLAM